MKLQNISEYKTYQQQTFQTTKHIKLQNISDYRTNQQQTFQTTKRINNQTYQFKFCLGNALFLIFFCIMICFVV